MGGGLSAAGGLDTLGLVKGLGTSVPDALFTL